ncbi:LacI family transcriptional regulator (plasmid) [Glaciihabitans sp. INWT7]|uniref:LacI family DNA-binding transcriptional regulator n=1 Tax=Glaciihabitans sp. INWT7 TaxID=2596912 RepID=UPI00162468CB|nr:LacI family DNA-binding transcriptional regulator [Glaciihabitans sp. INWT7]QNE48634.1 LacI family transcriptional regulator [Glaciihabitans sp. INWT7]
MPDRSAATLGDVARLAGVSQSVASRALNDDRMARISASTRERVKGAASKLDYIPDHTARALRAGRAGALALVVPDVGNAVFSELFAGVRAASAAERVTVLLGQLNEPSVVEEGLSGIAGNGRVDGIILQRPERMTDAELEALLDVRAPVVLFNSVLRRRMGSVILDDHRAAWIATDYLLSLGHTRIGLIGGTREHDAARRREAGYREAMHHAGRRIDLAWVSSTGWEAEAAAGALEDVLAGTRRPTALVVASVNAAIGVVAAALRRGLRIPDDLSIVSIQDTWVAGMMVPSVTVVRMPLREAGTAAARMLLAYASGGGLHNVVITDPAPVLVVRESTARLA